MVGAGLLPLEVEKLAVAGEIQNLFIGQSLSPRDIQLALVVNGTSLANTHSQRATLLAKLPYGREVWLRYNGANSTLQIKAAVAGSFDLELNDLPFGQRATLQFTALDPRFSISGPERTTITFSASPSSSYARQRTDKDGWGAMTSGIFAPVRRAIQGPDGTIYIGTAASGGTAKVQKWTGSAWTDLASFTGSISGGPVITDLVYVSNAVDANDIYVLGDYTLVGGVSSTGLARINLSSGVVTAFGTAAAGGIPRAGLYDPVYQRLYVAGDFTSLLGLGSSSYIMYYDYVGGWTAMTGRPTAAIYALVGDSQGNVILGGNFTDTFADRRKH
jgi:hypothetical protein